MRAVIGVDIGGTKTLCVLFNQAYKVFGELDFKTSPADGRKRFRERLSMGIRKLARTARKCEMELLGLGVACAGRVDVDAGVIEESPNVPYLDGCELKEVLKEGTNLRAVIGNDVQMALYGEHRMGVAKGCRHVLGVFFGTGVGGAAIIDGELYRGASGYGGQVGATSMHPTGGKDTLGCQGILDQIISKSALAGAAIGMGIKQWAPNLYEETGTDVSKVTWGALARARKAGDKHIDELVRSRLSLAGVALSSIVNFMNPEMVVLGGGLTEEMPRVVVGSVEEGLREHLVPEVAKDLKVKAAKFGNRAGAIGAARMAFKEFKED